MVNNYYDDDDDDGGGGGGSGGGDHHHHHHPHHHNYQKIVTLYEYNHRVNNTAHKKHISYMFFSLPFTWVMYHVV